MRTPVFLALSMVAAGLALAGSCSNEEGFPFPLDGGLLSNPKPPTAAQEARFAFVGHGYNADIDVVTLADMTVAGTITGAGGYRMVLNPSGTKLYSTGGDQDIYISNTQTRTLTTSFNPGANYPSIIVRELEAIAISPDGSRVYVFDEQGSTAIFVIDTSNDTVINAASLALDEPENAVVSPDGAFVYVADNSVVAKINTSTLQIVGTAPCGSDCHGLALNASGTRIFVKGVSTNLDIIDTATMTDVGDVTGSFSNDGYYIARSADGARIYAVNESSSLAVINAATGALIQSVTTSLGNARGVATTPSSAFVLVATGQGLIKFDASTLQEVDITPTAYYQSVVVLN